MMPVCEKKGPAAVAWLKGVKHKFYEDRYRLLSNETPLVCRMNRGEIFAVFDGIGSAPEGMRSAQTMCDILLDYYQQPDEYGATHSDLHRLLMQGNMTIQDWGFMPGTDRPRGGCAGTIAWIYQNKMFIFHAGDTLALLIRSGKSRQLTQMHDYKGAIYRYFGLGSHLEIDVLQESLTEGDRILLLSDGVTKVFHPHEAADFVDNYDDISKAATELARISQLKGSQDDITVLVIEIREY
jgi:serine/threonine protein phosphatase PrpC